MSTIWITGGKGFIGRHVARHVAGEGHQVHGIGHGEWPCSDASTWAYTSWSAGEIDATTLDRLADRSGLPATIYHLAGGSSVAASFQNPYEDFARTVESTARLLEWMRLHAATVGLVAVSSAAVYGASHRGAIPEASSLSPYSPYGVHKAMKEGLCRSYGQTFGLQLALVRLFSVYGPGLRKQLIWDLCSKLDAADLVPGPVMLGGTGLEVRDWLHVSDAARLLWLARKECSPDCPVVNGGTGVGTTVREVADCVARAWGVPPSVSFSGAIRHGDPPSLVADTSGAARLGFRPSIALEPGVIETVAWFKNAGGARSTA